MDHTSRLFDILSHQIKRFPKDDALSYKVNGEWMNFSSQAVWDIAEKLGAAFLKMGLSGKDYVVEQQDKIAVISRNRPEWVILDLACQMAGIILCPIYPTTHVNELEFIFNDAGIKAVFISGEEINHKIAAVKPYLHELQQVFSFDALPETIYWQDLLQDVSAHDIQQLRAVREKITASICATIIYTSGTTGSPKGVMLSHKNIVSNVINSIQSFPFEDAPTSRSLSFLPLNHIFERMITYIYLATGISVYYADSLDTIPENLREIKPMLFGTVPRLLEKMYDRIQHKGKELSGIQKKIFNWALALAERFENRPMGIAYNLQWLVANKLVFSKWRAALGGNIRMIVTGGAACPEKLIRIFSAGGIPIYEGYGPTENSPVISVNRKEKGGTKFGTVGPPIMGQEVRLEPDGEICVKGPSVMLGYYKQPQMTSETVIDGWLHTGDIGVFEEGKFLRITDRKKELFKTSGGKYVAPQPVENKLRESPYIEQVMVLGSERKFVSALIVPSEPNLKEWMRENQIPFTTFREALNEPRVIAFYRELVNSFNKFFNNVEQVKKFEMLPTEWTIDGGELTPTLKLKRKVILEKYKKTIDEIYDV